LRVAARGIRRGSRTRQVLEPVALFALSSARRLEPPHEREPRAAPRCPGGIRASAPPSVADCRGHVGAAGELVRSASRLFPRCVGCGGWGRVLSLLSSWGRPQGYRTTFVGAPPARPAPRARSAAAPVRRRSLVRSARVELAQGYAESIADAGDDSCQAVRGWRSAWKGRVRGIASVA